MSRWRVPLGFLAGFLYIFFSHVASWGRMALGVGLALAGLLLRGWAAGYLEKGKRLAQDGPYAFWRHPLYGGSFLLALGFCLGGTGAGLLWHNVLLWTVFVVLFFWVYPRRIKEEERSLEQYFGDAWRAYAARTHRFLPRLRPLRRENVETFLWARYRKNREYNAFVGWLAGVGVLTAKAFLMVR